MSNLLFVLLLLVGAPALAQQPRRYALWADGLVNAQLTKSSLYLLGTGLRAEVSQPLRNPTRTLFAQVGYGHFFRKSTSAFTADFALLNVGYRYQPHRAFGVDLAFGAQYWREQLRLRFADGAVNENLHSLRPSTTLGFRFRLKTHYLVGLEDRLLWLPGTDLAQLVNNPALSLGYAF